MMTSQSPLKIFTLELQKEFDRNIISPHVRYISPDNVLNDLYKILNCDLVTCTEIEVNGKLFDVYSDDEALLKDKPVPNLYLDDGLIIFGSLAFAKADDDGKLISLSDEEIHLLWHFSLSQFDKLLNFIKKQRRFS